MLMFNISKSACNWRTEIFWLQSFGAKRRPALLEMLELPEEDGSDYEGVDEDFDEDSNEDSDSGYVWDVPALDVLRTRFEDSYNRVREVKALLTLSKLEPATLAQHADAVVVRLENSDDFVRMEALKTLAKLEPVTLAQHADAVAARLEDSDDLVRLEALKTLAKLEAVTLAQHAGAVAARLEDSLSELRTVALETLAKLEPMTLAQHAHAVVKTLNDHFKSVRDEALTTLRALPLVVTRDIDFESHILRERLLGRIAWYRCRLRLRVRRIALYWYALPYRPSGPGHARDVEAWSQMNVE